MRDVLKELPRFTIIMLCVYTSASWCSPLKNVPDSLVQSVLASYNQNLPRQIAPNARQEKSIYKDGFFIHRYSHSTKTGAQLRSEGTEAKQRSGVFPALCSDSVTKPLLKLGLGFRFQYYGVDNQLGADVVITPADCGL